MGGSMSGLQVWVVEWVVGMGGWKGCGWDEEALAFLFIAK